MPDFLLLAAATVCCIAGMGWLALAMDGHWRQVRSGTPAPKVVVTLRVLGTLALLASLALCLVVDHVSMASLVWVLCLAAAAQLIAYTLATRPRLLAPLIAWVSQG